MKVLIACEESQTVCKAFRARGHEAYSCDIQEPSGGKPEWHILGDADGARGATRVWHFGIVCTECTIRLPRSDYKLAVQMGRCGEIQILEDDRQEAADLWNRRADNG